MSYSPQAIGVIPARYQSTRFPGKPLVQISGKSLIQRTYESASRSKMLTKLVVATDDQRIYDHVKSFGGNVAMTSVNCPTGTDRIAEFLSKEKKEVLPPFVVNIQGDEPCIEPEVIDAVVQILAKNPSAVMSTAAKKIMSEEEALSSSVVKCVINQEGSALYFSRSLIPGGVKQKYRPEITYYKHIGIYAFLLDFLFQYASMPATPLQLAEDLEQLKTLEAGYTLKVAILDSQSLEVNTPEDIKKVEQLLCKQNISSSQAESVLP